MLFFWFRRDLRLDDNAALYYALKSSYKVLPVFIFDTNILDELEDKSDARVSFIHQTIAQLQQQLHEMGSTLLVKTGKPAEIWQELLVQYPQAKAIYSNRDYEGYARCRDEMVAVLAKSKGVDFQQYKDHVVFEEKEVLKKDATPYTVFTPYSRTWLAQCKPFYLKPYPTRLYLSNLEPHLPTSMPSLAQIGFRASSIQIPIPILPTKVLQNYAAERDYPQMDATSKLGLHLRFGTVSVRNIAQQAQQNNSPVFLNELIWRDFYSMILSNFPYVEKSAFRQEYDQIEWRNNKKEFECWCQGTTGYPLVDAGMRQLNATGYMHNRVRMVVASFLTKHLLIDWRWGEAYFAKKLLDFDLASNNGGWQWAAGCGTDAAPYFRIFNPSSQQEKFDAKRLYIRRWLPEYGTFDYPVPIVVHEAARARCLATYKKALSKGE